MYVIYGGYIYIYIYICIYIYALVNLVKVVMTEMSLSQQELAMNFKTLKLLTNVVFALQELLNRMSIWRPNFRFAW